MPLYEGLGGIGLVNEKNTTVVLDIGTAYTKWVGRWLWWLISPVGRGGAGKLNWHVCIYMMVNNWLVLFTCKRPHWLSVIHGTHLSDGASDFVQEAHTYLIVFRDNHGFCNNLYSGIVPESRPSHCKGHLRVTGGVFCIKKTLLYCFFCWKSLILEKFISSYIKILYSNNWLGW